MVTATKHLLERTAGDLMSTDLLLIPREMSLQAAARLLSHQNVSGAPVVDNHGRCVGVLSATDFVHWVEKGKAGGARRHAEECFCSSWQMADLGNLPEDAVAYHMTADPVMVHKDRPIGKLARMMLDAHIHRVIVVDEQEVPLGIVTTTDILAAVAYAEKA